MINRIECDSHRCVHNTEGKCTKGIVQVNEFVGDEALIAFCDSFALEESLTAHSAAALRDPRLGIIRHGWQTEMSRELGPDGQRSDIGCSVYDCVHNRDFYCWADRIRIDEPETPGSTLSSCETYTRR